MSRDPILQRLRDRGSETEGLPGLAGQAGELFRKGGLPAPAEPLSPVALRRIRLELEQREGPRATFGIWARRVAVASSVAVTLGLGFAAVRHSWLHKRDRSPPRPSVVAGLAPLPVALPPAPPVEAAPMVMGSPIVHHLVRHIVQRSHRVEVVPTAPLPDPLVTESQLIGQALQQLERDKRPESALATLNDYHRRFPTGVLGTEAALAELDADLALRRRGPALAVLEGLGKEGLDELPRAEELKLLRGELLADEGRCAEALPVFEAAPAEEAPELGERRLYRQAACLDQLGRVEGSRSAFQRYLQLYPQGQFAAAAERALQIGR